MVTLGRFHCLGFNGELEKKRRLEIIERNNVVWFNGSRHFISGWIHTMESNMNKNENEIKPQIKQLIITGKLWCDNCGERSEIQWEEWVCDYSNVEEQANASFTLYDPKIKLDSKNEHPLNEDGESVCSDETCHPRDEEVTFEGMNINEATEYILQKEVHPRCAECGSLYGW